ncbi:hypothetical protein POM88_019808 [Heracleum sosnowskyi]|uniref:Ankyrin repeat protein n=1 Tax=Heracleum sosnowskyi TaxID=360622 RepID=A0AAD8IBC9_9APIA|nr:hypothetical protein POM88_019808 [Heracleum sosnowskyi]
MIIDGVKCTFMSKNVDLDEYKIHKIFAGTGLFYETEEYGRTALELAVARNYVKVVELILDLQSPAYQDYWISDDFIGLMPLIYKAKDCGYRNIVKLLTERYETGAGLSIHLKNQVCLISAIAGRKTGKKHVLKYN